MPLFSMLALSSRVEKTDRKTMLTIVDTDWRKTLRNGHDSTIRRTLHFILIPILRSPNTNTKTEPNRSTLQYK